MEEEPKPDELDVAERAVGDDPRKDKECTRNVDHRSNHRILGQSK